MCRSIKVLRDYDNPPDDDEIVAAALQYVRKISGFRAPSQANTPVFEAAVEAVADASRELLRSLTPTRAVQPVRARSG